MLEEDLGEAFVGSVKESGRGVDEHGGRVIRPGCEGIGVMEVGHPMYAVHPRLCKGWELIDRRDYLVAQSAAQAGDLLAQIGLRAVDVDRFSEVRDHLDAHWKEVKGCVFLPS